MEYSEKIKEALEKNNGYITTQELKELGVSKAMIPKYVSLGLIRKVKFGLFMDNNIIEDEFYILEKKYPAVIYSYGTALYFLKLINELPEKIDITIKRKDKVRGDYQVHYIVDKLHSIGVIEVPSMYGNPIKIYNAERCICDILRAPGVLDIELEKKILATYFKSKDKDLKLLLKYAEIFNIYDKVSKLVKLVLNYK